MKLKFVCATNKNRSPVASLYAQFLLKKEGMQGSIKIESRGLRGKGNLLDRLFREAAFEARREAYDFTQAKSLRLTAEDVAGADFLIVPSPKVFEEIKALYPEANILLLGRFHPDPVKRKDIISSDTDTKEACTREIKQIEACVKGLIDLALSGKLER